MVERCCSGVVGKNYTITTSFNSSNYYEKELNDVFSTATDISLGSSYTGTINNYYDKDYYKITPTSNGYINLNFKHTYANSDDDWNIYTYVYSNGEYTELSSTNINLNESENVSLPSIGAKANGVYYVMVERCCSGVVGKNYTITTAYVCSSHSYTTKITQAGLTSNGKIVKTCSKCGYTKTETIYAAKTIKFSATKYTYDGKVKKPSVTIKDSKGNAIASSNYTITYPSGRKNVGKYTVKVTFKGNYSGSKNLTFTINPPKTSISKVTAGKKAFTVKWAKKTTQVTGYEIQYSTSSSFKSGNKTVKVTSAKTASKTIKSLKAKRKYYVRVRTYKTVGKTPYYSDWSAKKSVTT